MTTIEAFEQAGKDLLVLGQQLKHAEFEFRRGHREQYLQILDRFPLLVKILERDLKRLPEMEPTAQPVRLDGDSTGGDAA